MSFFTTGVFLFLLFVAAGIVIVRKFVQLCAHIYVCMYVELNR